MAYKIEQKDALGNWGEDFTWNQGGNQFATEQEAEAGIDFILGQYGDIERNHLRVVESVTSYQVRLSNVPDGAYTESYLGTDTREFETREEAERVVAQFEAAKLARPQDFEPDMEAEIVEG